MTGFLKMEQTVLFVNQPPPTPPASVVFNPSPTPPPRVVVYLVPFGPGFLSVVVSMSGVAIASLSFAASGLELDGNKWDELKENSAEQIHDLKGRISVLEEEVLQAALEVVDLESRLWDSQKEKVK
ncbi:hypothetical protein ACLB2K_038628 [Fragaria x ananassa]